MLSKDTRAQIYEVVGESMYINLIELGRDMIYTSFTGLDDMTDTELVSELESCEDDDGPSALLIRARAEMRGMSVLTNNKEN